MIFSSLYQYVSCVAYLDFAHFYAEVNVLGKPMQDKRCFFNLGCSTMNASLTMKAHCPHRGFESQLHGNPIAVVSIWG